jgi:hypothetical protein
MKATTDTGILRFIDDCYIQVGSLAPIGMYIMPEIQDSHGASYSVQNGIGRSLPAYTFGNGEARTIGWTIHLYADYPDRLLFNLQTLRIIESCTYPRIGTGNLPFVPPSICKLKCGAVLGTYEIAAVLKNYNVTFPVDVQWSTNIPGYGSIPYKFDITCQFEVVYDASQLPGAERIITDGN